MKYIDKAAIVAEIQRRKELVSDPILSGNDLMIGERNAYFNLFSFFDTLEVKEVDLEEEFDKCCENYIFNDLYVLYTARRFFELGFKAKVG